MTWLAKFLAGIGAKLALAAAIVGAVLLFIGRVFRAGGDAERAKNAKAAHEHQTTTADKAAKSDDAVADPATGRKDYVRKKFERSADEP